MSRRRHRPTRVGFVARTTSDMKITTKDTALTIMGEQSDGEPEIGYIFEMVTEPAKLKDFGFGQDVISRAQFLKDANEDDKPEFPVLRVEEGWSGSGRLWSGEILDSIASQTNALEPVGHLGHIPDNEASTSFPEPQTTWIGAVTKMEKSEQKDHLGEMVKVAYFTGYNLPGAKVRGYIKSKAVRGISWWGRGDMVPIPGRGVAVKSFTLQTLDWARKLSEGMPTSRIVAMAREMKETDKMEKDLSQVTPEELKREAPNLYTLLVGEMSTEHDEQIAEMEKKIEEGGKSRSLVDRCMEVLGITDPEKLIDEMTSLKEKVGAKAAAMVKTALDTLMEEKVPNEERRALVMRLLPVGEMEAKASDVKGQEEVDKLVGEMVTAAFDKDEVIQQYVGEMQPLVVRRREELRSGGSSLDNNEYVGERTRVSLS